MEKKIYFIYRTTRCLALSAVDLTFSLRSLVTTLVVVVVVLLAGFVVFLALAVAAAAVVAAGVSFFFAEAEASFVSFFGPMLKGGNL